MTEQEVISQIAEIVLELGYRSQTDGNRVLTSVGGMKTVITWTEPGSIQLSAGVRAVPPNFGLKDVNEYNRRYRFGSLYSDPDGSLILQADFLFAADDPDKARQIEKMLTLFEACAGEMRQALFEAAERAEPNEEDDRAAGADIAAQG